MNLNGTNYLKEKIISTIKNRGPSLPNSIAKTINQSPLFTSAFLSELYSEGKIKISNMRVGSSPLYFIQSQEEQLENFIHHLNQKEKEAFSLLKTNKILEDEAQHPAIRVALRSLKDFAIPIRIRVNEEAKNFWRYFLLPESEIETHLQKKEKPILNTQKVEEEKVEEKQIITEKANENKKEIEQEIKEKPKRIKKRNKETELKFANNMKEYLESKEIEILETVLAKKGEYSAKIRTDALFGKQEYYLISKDKKKISEEELIVALQRAQEQKMPALLMARGDLDKKALEYFKAWRNLIKFEKIKF